MTASINIYSEEDSNALLIPSRAISFKPDSVLLKKYTIIRVKKDSIVKSTRSKEKTGLLNDSIEVLKHSTVWTKHGDTLIQKRVITGLNDDTNVKIVSGLSPEEEVITIAVAADVKATADVTQKSPFMPTMGSRKKSTTPTTKNK
jgi:HlyD family secretion protein